MSIFDTGLRGRRRRTPTTPASACSSASATCTVIANLITGGVCHRFPDLKFVSVESGVGWIPFALEHLDWQWKNCGVPQEHPEYDLLPSEYFKRQIYGCFWFENDTREGGHRPAGPRLHPVRDRLPAPDVAWRPGRPRPPWSRGEYIADGARATCPRTCCARSSTTTPPSSTTWIDAFSLSQRGVQGMARRLTRLWTWTWAWWRRRRSTGSRSTRCGKQHRFFWDDEGQATGC